MDTRLITAAVVTIGGGADKTYLRPVVGKTAEKFEVKIVIADSQYEGTPNFTFIRDLGAKSYIHFKSTTKGKATKILEDVFGNRDRVSADLTRPLL